MHFNKQNKKMRKVHNRIYSAVLVFALAASLAAGAVSVSPTDTYAKTAKQKRDEAKKNLSDTNSKIDNIKDNQVDIKSDISQASKNLKNLMSKQKTLKQNIKDKQAEVEQANKELVDAQNKEDEEYKAMKLRIQYMYENSTDNSLWTAIIESHGLSDMLNRIEYVSDLYQSDRQLMDQYQAAVKEVEDWTTQLADDMNNLLALQDEYEKQQGELNTLLAKLEKKKDKYAQQLADAKEQAKDYQKTIDEQNEIIRQQEAAAARQNAATYDGGGSGASGGMGSDSYLQDSSYNPSNATSVSGAAVVAYAQQFVGNPYVWGGTSLTSGADCSGFVQSVYANFGVSLPRTSYEQQNCGTEVSYADAQPGDLICYGGHVAIYMGNGRIVHASNSVDGIKISDNAAYRTIVSVRRLV